MDDVDPRLNVREGVRRGEDGLAFELLVQVAVGPPVQREGSAVDKTSQVIVLIKVGDPVFHLVSVEVRLHVCDLNECLQREAQRCQITSYSTNSSKGIHISANTRLTGVQLALIYRIGVFNDFNLVLSESLPVEVLTEKRAGSW